MKLLRTPFMSALLGGALVAFVLLVLDPGDDGKTTTVVQPAPLTRGAANGGGNGSLSVRDIYKRESPGVVFVSAEVTRQTDSPFDFFPQEERGESTGSGFVIDRQGHVLTNAHVIQGATRVTISFEDKRTVEAKVVGRDLSTDMALLKVDAEDLDLRPLPLGTSKSVQVGDPTIAIGNPFGLDRTLTTGVVSALQRRIEAPNGFGIDNVIQTDAAINPGNSGGPLLDAAGRVVGINSQIATGGGGQGNIGIGFAVPIDTAKRVIPQLKEDGRVERAYLGITGADIDGALARLNLAAKSGVLVQTVEPGGPAAKAGLRGGDQSTPVQGRAVALGGDVIQEVDGEEIKTMDEVRAIVDRKKPGDEIKVLILREGRRKTIEVELGTRPERAPTQ